MGALAVASVQQDEVNAQASRVRHMRATLRQLGERNSTDGRR